ncbi:MAG: cobyric acid synthase CobQ [Rhodospirillaceae bacterium TMED8]|nr:cobyric acid synthase CobQ [Magnetovibrio sp.]OUT50558.1 MAG: cobyric acid synthase CobQ [Rhodospirillaceae bacterium TMED8]
MIQGTGSDVGKSLIVAGLCRALKKRGLRAAPFKPQNMSNNAAVTPDGGEIGRAQALQARAAGIKASVHMNPVLLKPQSDIGAQVIVQGRVKGNAKARDFHALKPELLNAVLRSFELLGQDADILIVEGAGSPAEVNLRAGDIANMGFAEAADVAVIICADIDRGGVIASLIGTHAVLSLDERARVVGYIVNKFRGDTTLFNDGLKIITEETGWRAFGVVPHFAAAKKLPAEDAMSLDQRGPEIELDATIKIVVPRLSRISNFDDLDPLIAEPDVLVQVIEAGFPLPLDADVILLPGSKSTLADLNYLKAEGWDIDILAHRRQGGLVVGLCGGYQMLGRTLADPRGIEGLPGTAEGLGLLNVHTIMGGDKSLSAVSGNAAQGGEQISGYEMHIGVTEGPDSSRPWVYLNTENSMNKTRPDGARSYDGRVMASYVHGIFSSDDFRSGFLKGIKSGRISQVSYEIEVDAVLDDLASHLEACLDIDALLATTH